MPALENGPEPVKDLPAEAGERVSSETATALVGESEAAVEARWSALSDAEVDSEIAAFRQGIRDISNELRSLGVAVSADEVQPPPLAGQEVAKGDDYTLGNVDDLDPSEWQVPPHCIPIHANVMTYDWSKLSSLLQFDVIMMDPPWQLATANPTRGVSLGYSQLTDADIVALPVPELQSNGFLFIWVINAKYKFTLDLFQHWGYELVDEIVWVKMTVNRRLAKSHGYYLQHAKEVCLVGKKGRDPPGMKSCVGSDVIYTERRGQSQKPEEIYQLIEELVPGGRYLEIFGRKNNLLNYWVTVGNEVTGTGLPKEDIEALAAGAGIPSAVFGRSTAKGTELEAAQT